MSSRSERFDANTAIFFTGGLLCCVPIRDPQFLDVRVRDNGAGTARVDQTLITVYQGGTNNLVQMKLTDTLGDAIFRLPVGQYDVRAQKAWYIPEDQRIANQNLARRSSRVVRFNKQPLYFFLHVDADRNGAIDNNRTEAPMNTPAPDWAWGANRRGAIIPVNVDNDNANLLNAGDHEDNVINGVNDQNSDIAHIAVRRHGGNNPTPGGWTAALSIASPAGQANPENHVRIFNGVAAGDAQLLGPGTAQAALANFDAHPRTLGMEALRYAGTGFDGVVSVRLTITAPNPLGGGNLTHYTEAQLRAASWVMPNHLDHADTVYVSRLPGDADSTAFVGVIDPLISNPAPGGGGAILSEEAYDDQWMQDCMEIGYSTWPGTGNGVLRMESVMRALRGRTLRNMPMTLRGVNFGYTYPGQGGGLNNTFNATGNLEVTPPATATNLAANGAGPKTYGWGRIYYGRGRPLSPFDVNTGQFLERQGVQKPFALNTDWLYVGHVDEMMSFIPTPGGNKPWKLLIASPTRAYAILNQMNGGLNGGGGVTPVMHRAPNALQLSVGQYQGVVPGNYWLRTATNVATTVADLLGNANSPIADPEDEPVVNPAHNGQAHATTLLTWGQLRTWNTGPVQNVLNGVVADLVNEIGLDLANDVIEVPVIFLPEEHLYDHNINTVLNQHPLTIAPGQPGGYTAGALTADMVNMLVVNNMLVAPKAFGPETAAGDEFQLYLTQQITAANNALRVRYVDDWDLYHAELGEVHCGTNTLRKPANGNDMTNWLASGAARWWEFPG